MSILRIQLKHVNLYNDLVWRAGEDIFWYLCSNYKPSRAGAYKIECGKEEWGQRTL